MLWLTLASKVVAVQSRRWQISFHNNLQHASCDNGQFKNGLTHQVGS